MSGYLHVFMTGEKVTPESAENGDFESAGYVEPSWSMTEFQDRNSAGTVLSVPLDDPNLSELIRDALEQYLGTWTDNGDGTFYGQDETVDYATGASYTYALHFVRKFIDPSRGCVEEPYSPFADIESE